MTIIKKPKKRKTKSKQKFGSQASMSTSASRQQPKVGVDFELRNNQYRGYNQKIPSCYLSPQEKESAGYDF